MNRESEWVRRYRSNNALKIVFTYFECSIKISSCFLLSLSRIRLSIKQIIFFFLFDSPALDISPSFTHQFPFICPFCLIYENIFFGIFIQFSCFRAIYLRLCWRRYFQNTILHWILREFGWARYIEHFQSLRSSKLGKRSYSHGDQKSGRWDNKSCHGKGIASSISRDSIIINIDVVLV